jgi:hypothetical protein
MDSENTKKNNILKDCLKTKKLKKLIIAYGTLANINQERANDDRYFSEF